MCSKINKIHFLICIFCWIICAIGAALAIVSSVVFTNDNSVWFNINVKYNTFFTVFSLVPVEPAIFISTIIHDIRNKKTFGTKLTTVVLFLITVAFGFAYIDIFIEMTGGV